jgi:hypothetical protein
METTNGAVAGFMIPYLLLLFKIILSQLPINENGEIAIEYDHMSFFFEKYFLREILTGFTLRMTRPSASGTIFPLVFSLYLVQTLPLWQKTKLNTNVLIVII